MPKFPSYYYVSDLGRCWSVLRKQIIKMYVDNHGYLQAYPFLGAEGKRVIIRIHREVAAAFVPNPNDYPQVQHINDNKMDNSASNLRWGTARMNQEDAERNKVEGYNHRRAVVGTHLKTGEIREYPSVNDVTKDGFNISNVRQCCKGRRNKAHGYRWQYKDEEKVQVSNIFLSSKT